MLKITSPVAMNLMKARALIEVEDNWCKGQREDPDGRHCALGALDIVIFGTCDCLFEHFVDDKTPEVQMLEAASRSLAPEAIAGRTYSTPAGRVVTHNNSLGHAATLQMFDRAIELALEEAKDEVHA